MNIAERWIASHFVKRFALSLASGAVAYLAAHALPGAAQLAGFGVQVTVHIDPERFADSCAVLFMALSQGGHEYLAAKYPLLGRWL